MKSFQALSGTAHQDIAIPYAFCELCAEEYADPKDRQRAMCECLNCNLPMCQKCRQKHGTNPRLTGHKIINYQSMMFNGNKFGKKEGGGGSNNNSVSPSRRSGEIAVSGNKTPRKSFIDMGTASMNSSGKFSVRNALGGGPEGSRAEPLELMYCPSHDGSPLDCYSINIREFMCRQCIKEIEGTQREIDLNPIPVEDAFRVLENRLNMQSLVNLDEKIRGLLDLVKKKKEFAAKDKEESLKQVAKQFEVIYRRLEDQKNALCQHINDSSD